MNEFPVALLHPRDQCIKKSFSVMYSPMMCQYSPKHVGVSVFNNMNVNIVVCIC